MNADEQKRADEVVRNTVAGLRVMSESGDWSVDRQTCTDAAALIESLTAELAESRRRADAAFRIANNTIYFNDRSDYLTALWDVCESIYPGAEDTGKTYIEDTHPAEEGAKDDG
jgi:hypothetical protein